MSKLVEISSEKKQDLIDKYSSMPDVEVIKGLSSLAYREFSSNDNYIDYALTLIRNINSNICPTVEQMKVILSNMFSNNIEGNMSLEENHKLETEEIVRYTTILNKYNIDYYVVGALPCFLKTNEKLFRYYDDIIL